MQRRKATFKLYPNAEQAARLEAWTRLHCELYNAALQERIEAYRKAGKSISWYEQQDHIPVVRADRPEFVELGSHAMKQTLKRLDLAFEAFFRRVKAGQTPGFPRFKSHRRFSGFSYPDRSGWTVHQHGKRGATIRVGSFSSTMMIRARGGHRFDSAHVKPNDLTITRLSDGNWQASVTLRVSDEACARQRVSNDVIGVDLGVKEWATFDNGERIDNPRFIRNALPEIARLQRARARKRKGSIRYRRLTAQLARVHRDVANARKDFLHKQTTALVVRSAVIATEQLRAGNMSRSARGTVEEPGSQVKQKAGLNREILSAGFFQTHLLLKYKAVEAGTRLHLCDTVNLKPSQRCAKCWALVPKTLARRVHQCPSCGHVADRDQNAASVMLTDALTPGEGVAARPKPLSTKVVKRKSSTREEPKRITGHRMPQRPHVSTV